MARSIALDPVCSRTGINKIVVPPAAKVTSIALDPKCRLITGTQTVTPEVAA